MQWRFIFDSYAALQSVLYGEAAIYSSCFLSSLAAAWLGFVCSCSRPLDRVLQLSSFPGGNALAAGQQQRIDTGFVMVDVLWELSRQFAQLAPRRVFVWVLVREREMNEQACECLHTLSSGGTA